MTKRKPQVWESGIHCSRKRGLDRLGWRPGIGHISTEALFLSLNDLPSFLKLIINSLLSKAQLKFCLSMTSPPGSWSLGQTFTRCYLLYHFYKIPSLLYKYYNYTDIHACYQQSIIIIYLFLSLDYKLLKAGTTPHTLSTLLNTEDSKINISLKFNKCRCRLVSS